MHGKFKKFYAVLMLISFVFASVSPAFAVGIFDCGGVFWKDGKMTVGESQFSWLQLDIVES